MNPPLFFLGNKLCEHLKAKHGTETAGECQYDAERDELIDCPHG